MNARVKELWVAALRSGKYIQGRRVLHNEAQGTFCCLGVLCELAAQEISLEQSSVEWDTLNGELVTNYGESRQSTVLPAEVMEWAGLTDWNPEISSYQGDTLATVNDSGMYDFRDIANMIEAYL